MNLFSNKKLTILQVTIFLVLVISFFTRAIGLVTFRKHVNGEEASLGIYLLRQNGDIPSQYIKKGSNRGYFHGFARVYYLPIIKFFKPTVFLLKFVTLLESLVFVLTEIILVWILYKSIYPPGRKKENFLVFPLTILYFAIPPLLLINWSLKARPEFLDTMIIGNILYILALKVKNIKNKLLAFLIGLIGALAFSGQPLIIFYLLPMSIYLAVYFVILRNYSIKKITKLLISFTFGLLIGFVPLIIYNNKRNWPIFNYLGSGVIEGKYMTPKARIYGFFNEAYPMFIGARNEWSNSNNLLANPIDEVLFISTTILLGIGLLLWLHATVVGRKFEKVCIFIISLLTFFLIVAKSNFASFLAEPRRVLPFYSFYFTLVSYTIFKLHSLMRNKFLQKMILLIPILLTLINLSTLIKVAYNYKDNISSDFTPEYLSKFYHSRRSLGKKLQEMQVSKIYTNGWIGSPTTFESKGKILWKFFPHTKYPSYQGFNFEPKLEKAAIVLYENESAVKVLNDFSVLSSLNFEDVVIFTNLEEQFESYKDLKQEVKQKIQ